MNAVYTYADRRPWSLPVSLRKHIHLGDEAKMRAMVNRHFGE